MKIFYESNFVNNYVEYYMYYIDLGTFTCIHVPFLCRLRSIAAHRDHFVWRLSVRVSVCLSACLSDSQTFFVVTHSYVSQATHTFRGMLPLCQYRCCLELYMHILFPVGLLATCVMNSLRAALTPCFHISLETEQEKERYAIYYTN